VSKSNSKTTSTRIADAFFTERFFFEMKKMPGEFTHIDLKE